LAVVRFESFLGFLLAPLRSSNTSVIIPCP
jgi:hypothetical protein